MTAEKYAKEKTPVDTGRLRNSMAFVVDGNDVYIGSNVEYAPPVEFGARNRNGSHMLQKAATQHSEEYKKLMEDSLKSE